MNTKKITLIIVAVLFATISLFSQEKEVKEKVNNRTNYLGINAGFTTGLGLSFRHWENKYGIQVTALPIKTKNVQFISAGITGLYSIKNETYYRHFLYLGNHVLVNKREYNYDYRTGENVPTTRNVYNAGFGYGFEVGRKVRFNLMVGYAAYDLLNPDYSLLPTAEIGLYFEL